MLELRLMWIALSISASFSLHYPNVRARIHSLPLPFSRHPLIHSFTLFLRVPPLNLYVGAYLAQFLPVIDAHSIRLRTL